MKRYYTGMLLSAIIVLLTGCSAFVDQDQVSMAQNTELVLKAGCSIGQTFVAKHGGLKAIEIYLCPDTNAQGSIILHLRDSPLSYTDILTASIPVSPGNQEGFYRFSFPAILHSHAHYYYALLEYAGSGQVKAHTGGLDSYLDGTLYYNHEPQESQTVFRLSYDPPLIILDLLLMVTNWIGYGVASLTILFFSGYWIVRKWAQQAGADFTPTLTLSTLSALATWMTFLVWAGAFIHLEAWSVRLIVGANTALGLIYFARDRKQWWTKKYWLGNNLLSTIALWTVVILAIALRLFVGRGLVMLPGSDAYHHTLIAQLFAEQGGIPRTYEPYAPLVSYSYHFGFHSIVALFRWLFGTELLVTTKTLALVLNGAIAAVVGLLSEQIAGNRRAGIVAAALVGLIMVSPFCLLRWSRFTQTAGTLFLTASLWVLSTGRKDTGWVFPPLLIAGMVFSHYRIAFFWALFVATAGGIKVLQHRRDEVKRWLAIAIISAVLVAPWLLRVAWIQHDPYGLRITYPTLEGYNDLERLEKPILSFITNVPVVVSSILLIIAAWLGKKNKTMQWALVAWCFVLVSGAIILPLTGVYFWDLKTSLLTLPIPLATLAGVGGDFLWNAARGNVRSAIRGILIIALVSSIGIGISHFPHLIYTAPPFLKPGDLVTMEWIENNTPKDALVLVDFIQFEWSPGWMVGIDAGYWIPLLAHRATVLPPMIYAWEWVDPSNLLAGFNASHALLLQQDEQSQSITDMLGKYGITHVFIEAQHWLLPPRKLAQDPRVRESYRQDRVWMFEVTK
ncbi:MAG: hypothetical protein QHJ74_10150 [Anaerolineae bacterium]|jgi:hypothetical protein|nr:hypothetical protein [Anaerolineae bacterium]